MVQTLQFIYYFLLSSYVFLFFILVPLFGLPASVIMGIRPAFRMFIKLFTRFGLALFTTRVVVKGRENLPPGRNVVLLCNHVSYTDPLIINAALNGAFQFIVPARFRFGMLASFTFRPAGIVVKDSGTPFMGAKVVLDVQKKVRQGESFILFPGEGVSERGNIPYIKEAFFTMLKELDAPILPVRITGSVEKRRGLIGNVSVVIGKPISKEDILKFRTPYVDRVILALKP